MGIVRGKTAHKTKDLTVIITVRPGGEAIVTHEEIIIDKLLSRLYDGSAARKEVSDKMYIEGRKKKKCPEKLVAEVTLYIVMTMDQAVMAYDYEQACGYPSERTMYRYTKDIELCGYTPRIRYEGGEYTCGIDQWLERGSAPLSDEPHVRRLNRVLEIYDAFSRKYYDALFPDGGGYGEYITDHLICVDLKASEVLKKLKEKHPEEPVTLRTVQRDLAVIAEALEHYRNIYL